MLDPRTSEQNSNMTFYLLFLTKNDGFGCFQEDGVVFREESSGNNERIGQYRFSPQIPNQKPLKANNNLSQCFHPRSYIDDTGKTITVKYSAGVNGFRCSLYFGDIYQHVSRKYN